MFLRYIICHIEEEKERYKKEKEYENERRIGRRKK